MPMGGGDAYDAFQVLRYDGVPDENRKVWLLEVNQARPPPRRG